MSDQGTEDRILLSHGGGGRRMHDLIRDLFRARLSNPLLDRGDDSALLAAGAGLAPSEAEGRLAFTTDSFVVDPLFFPGGDIGRLAICGTVNDLATAGARPLALSASFILEEGLPMRTLERVVDSMREAVDEAGVAVATGDTKVVARGAADKMFITTSGVGIVPAGLDIGGGSACAGDAVLMTGPIGDHGVAVLSQREGLALESDVESDCAPLGGLVAALLDAVGAAVHAMRDPTRGGLASSLNEVAEQSGVCIEIDEERVPVRPGVAVACEMLGLDPLHMACEGRMVIIIDEQAVGRALDALRAHSYGRDACAIGRVLPTPAARVHVRTALGTRRILDLPVGEMLPRIC